MIKPFLVGVFLIFVMGGSMSLHYFNFQKQQRVDPLLKLVQLSKHSNLSLSTAYSEKEFNPTYPEMSTLRKMDFIYE